MFRSALRISDRTPAYARIVQFSFTIRVKETSDMARPQYDHLWPLVHAERAALADDLADLAAEQWRHGTLCREWDVEQVVGWIKDGGGSC